MLGWLALALLVAAGLYVVVRLIGSWAAASRRFHDGPTDDGPTDDGPTDDGPPDGVTGPP